MDPEGAPFFSWSMEGLAFLKATLNHSGAASQAHISLRPLVLKHFREDAGDPLSKLTVLTVSKVTPVSPLLFQVHACGMHLFLEFLVFFKKLFESIFKPLLNDSS